ncbi:MAG: hypothetical protein DRP01_00500 [Archaeoglobales archaeon]|nr:MAG: hypothetical protein DRP01_00500 [Archaeoglobales archaeon]
MEIDEIGKWLESRKFYVRIIEREEDEGTRNILTAYRSFIYRDRKYHVSIYHDDLDGQFELRVYSDGEIVDLRRVYSSFEDLRRDLPRVVKSAVKTLEEMYRIAVELKKFGCDFLESFPYSRVLGVLRSDESSVNVTFDSERNQVVINLMIFEDTDLNKVRSLFRDLLEVLMSHGKI